jgi:osmotically inducible protein OsmC
MAIRKANAVWEGALKEGRGTMKLSSGAYEGPFTWSSRFEESGGTNPEELIAAAHAGCFSMAFSAQLTNAGFTPARIQTTANVHFEKLEPGWRIVKVHLVSESQVPGIDAAQFQRLAETAKQGCPISNALNPSIEITLDAKLV